MQWLNRLPGFQRSPAGWEWWIWRRLPSILLGGTLAPAVVMAVVWWMQPGSPSPAEQREAWHWAYIAMGVVVLHWTLVLTLAIGCVIVMIMKGPAYVADAYPVPHSDHPVAERQERPRQQGLNP